MMFHKRLSNSWYMAGSTTQKNPYPAEPFYITTCKAVINTIYLDYHEAITQ